MTKVKLLNIISFFPFLTQIVIGQKINPNVLKNLAFIGKIAINFHSGGFTATTFCFNRYSPSKILKYLMILPVSLLSSQHLISPKSCPKTMLDLIFLLVSSEVC